MEQVLLQPIDRLYLSVARNPGAVAIAGSAGGDVTGGVTYSELGRAIAELAAAFQNLDGAPGSRVGICLPNTIEHLLALLATYAAGKVWVPLNPRNARAELDAMIAATRPTIIVDDASTVRGLIAEWDGKAPKRIERGAEDAQIIKFGGGGNGTTKPRAAGRAR